jgi:hypothetical protein
MQLAFHNFRDTFFPRKYFSDGSLKAQSPELGEQIRKCTAVMHFYITDLVTYNHMRSSVCNKQYIIPLNSWKTSNILTMEFFILIISTVQNKLLYLQVKQ